MSLVTTVIGISERAVQDTANLATTSGVNCTDIVSGVSGCLPGPTIDRGMETLKCTDNRLKDHVLPIDREKRFYVIHDRLFATGEQLDEKRKRSGLFRQLSMLPKTRVFERETVALYKEVHRTSQWFESVHGRRYTPCAFICISATTTTSIDGRASHGIIACDDFRHPDGLGRAFRYGTGIAGYRTTIPAACWCSVDGSIELLPRTPQNPTNLKTGPDMEDPAGVVEGQNEVPE
ncbi:hypothetical protein C8Q78DRAFT_995266 [Trametes maxima]|nr:hypothetical protein C8Q78DRAFT_995266 [Trametes maxima]